jgi:3-oxoacyl-(acyl-carrier-protein) synthase
VSPSIHRRVVITGLGVVAPNGIGKAAFWRACIAGRSGVRDITLFDASALPTRIAGEIPDFDPEALGLTPEECMHMDRGTQLAIAAANLAIQDANLVSALTEEERASTGVCMGAAMAFVAEGERLWAKLTSHGTRHLQTIIDDIVSDTAFLTNSSAAAIAAHHQLHGPSMVISTGCSAGADAIGQAFWTIQEGGADRMLAGGTDSAISYAGINVFSVMGALSTRNEEPARASRPYDAGRDGFVMAEGAGVLLLEERDLALARGAHIYAELAAFVSNSNAYHMTALPANGVPLQQLLTKALDEAAMTPDQLDYISAHGSSTLANEVAETSAYKATFGERAHRIPISATKSLIGHSQGAAGAIETLVTALAVDQQLLPPTINLDTADAECDLDYVPNVARRSRVHVALTHSSGFGGVNAALILVRRDDGRTGVAPAAEGSLLELAPDGSLRGAARRADEAGRAVEYERPHGFVANGGRSGARYEKRRVVITGLGTVAPNGIGNDAFWDATRQGLSGIKAISRFPTYDLPIGVAGEVSNFSLDDVMDRKLANRTDRMTHFAFAAIQEALSDAGLVLEQEDPQRMGAVIANTQGGMEFIMNQIAAIYTRGPRAMSAYSAIAWLQVANIGHSSIHFGFQGHCKTPVNDAVGGLDALGIAFGAIARGAADVLITGGCEALLHPYFLVVQARKGYCATGDDPCAYRPFDRRAAGFVLAEGAGICILEEYEHARQRGAHVYGEIIGFGQTNDANGLLPPGSDGKYYARAMRVAMRQAGITAEDIAYVSLDGRGVPSSDRGEVAALRATFGSALDLPVSVPRSMIGHSYAAAGALDTITALLALQHGLIPPTINCEELDASYGLNLVRGEARPLSQPVVLLGGRGIGGANTVIAIRKSG